MRIIFVSNNWDDAHQQTRLTGLGSMGIQVIPMGFKRKYYEGSSRVKPLWTGSMIHGSYLKRLNIYFQYAFQLFSTAKKSDWVYVFGFDIFIVTSLVRLLKGFRIAHEIPDIREAFFERNLTGGCLRLLEMLFIPQAQLIIPTSEAYSREYFHKIRQIKIQNHLTIENKIHVQPELYKASTNVVRKNGKIRIGYFGLLRCPFTLQCLILLANRDKYEIILRGIFMPHTASFETIIRNTKGICYDGPYAAPEDLREMYTNIDICWAAYPFSGSTIGNHLWARTNRYYESLYFQCPTILQNNTEDSTHSAQLGLKVINLDFRNPEQSVEVIEKNLTENFLSEARERIAKVSESAYIITDEYTRLLTCLQQKR